MTPFSISQVHRFGALKKTVPFEGVDEVDPSASLDDGEPLRLQGG